MAQGLGAHGGYVERPEDIHPALERAQKKAGEGVVALVNVKTNYRARAQTVRFSNYETEPHRLCDWTKRRSQPAFF